MLFLGEKRVHIGVNMMADEAVRHGVLWLKDAAGEQKNRRVPVIIDKPHLLRHGLNFATWRRLKRQIEKMGMHASHLELNIDGARYSYKLDVFKEVYASEHQNQPAWQTLLV
jgi:hypothetical protein